MLFNKPAATTAAEQITQESPVVEFFGDPILPTGEQEITALPPALQGVLEHIDISSLPVNKDAKEFLAKVQAQVQSAAALTATDLTKVPVQKITHISQLTAEQRAALSSMLSINAQNIKAAEIGSEIIKERIREKAMPMSMFTWTTTTNDQLVPQLESEENMRYFDYEVDSPASLSVGLYSNPSNYTFSGRRGGCGPCRALSGRKEMPSPLLRCRRRPGRRRVVWRRRWPLPGLGCRPHDLALLQFVGGAVLAPLHPVAAGRAFERRPPVCHLPVQVAALGADLRVREQLMHT